VTLVFAVLSSALFGIGVALQQRPASSLPDALSARPTILLRLVRRPSWLLGVVAEISGFVLQVLALRTGSLVVVQPVITVSLVFTIGLSALWSDSAITPLEWASVVAVVVGLSVFLLLAQPRPTGGANASVADWLGALLSLALAIGVLVVVGLRRGGRSRAALFGAAAGLSDAAMAVVTKAFAHDINRGVSHAVVSWTPYTLVGAGIIAMTISQTAYQAGRPTVSLPIITVTDPVISSAVGVALFGEVIHLDRSSGPAAVAAIGLMVAGLVFLSRSPHVVETAPRDEPSTPTEAASVER
jgi:drug/metabolite transporter (DMT)-like permease